jgi:hypothetical protein
MKEKVAKELCECHRGFGAWDSASELVKDFWRFTAGEVLTLLSQEIEEVKKTNPYQERYDPEFYDAHEAYDTACQAILQRINSKYNQA